MIKYKNGNRYFYRRLILIMRGFSINELKNIFNATLSQFLKDDKKYNQKIAYGIFEDEYDWVTNKLIERIYGYISLWIVSLDATDYGKKYLHTK